MHTCPRSSVSSRPRGERSSFDGAARPPTGPESRWPAPADGCAALDGTCGRGSNGASCRSAAGATERPEPSVWDSSSASSHSERRTLRANAPRLWTKSCTFVAVAMSPRDSSWGQSPAVAGTATARSATVSVGPVRVGSTGRRRLRRRPSAAGRRYSGIPSTILPSCSPRSRRSCAARASASGKTVSTIGRARPLRTSSYAPAKSSRVPMVEP
jgi:hypothetical protein